MRLPRSCWRSGRDEAELTRSRARSALQDSGPARCLGLHLDQGRIRVLCDCLDHLGVLYVLSSLACSRPGAKLTGTASTTRWNGRGVLVADLGVPSSACGDWRACLGRHDEAQGCECIGRKQSEKVKTCFLYHGRLHIQNRFPIELHIVFKPDCPSHLVCQPYIESLA